MTTNGSSILLPGEESQFWTLAYVVQRPDAWSLLDVLEADDYTNEHLRPVFNAMAAENRALDMLTLFSTIRIQPEYRGEVAALATEPIHLDEALLRLHIAKLLESTYRREIEAAKGNKKRIDKASDKYERRKQTVQSREAKLRAILAERRVVAATVIPKPVPVFSLNSVTISTPGNIGTISALQKGGKSAVVSALNASVLPSPSGYKKDTFGFSSSNPNGLAVVHIDTEQSHYDHWLNIQRALRRAGTDKEPPWFYSHNFRGLTATECIPLLKQQLKDAAAACKGIHSVILDGGAEFVTEVNDAKESNAIVTDFLALSSDYRCFIWIIIHMNPPSGRDKSELTKSRGHLGSQLLRKSETNLMVKKNRDEVSTIFATENRGAPIPESTGPQFQWSDEAGMHVSCETRADTKDTAKITKFKSELASIYEHKSVLRHKELFEQIGAVTKTTSATTWEARFDAYRTHKLIRQAAGLIGWERVP